MEEKRNYFIVYNCIEPSLAVLSKKECGDLFTWALEYSVSGVEPNLDGQSSGVKVLWAILKYGVDESEEMWQAEQAQYAEEGEAEEEAEA